MLLSGGLVGLGAGNLSLRLLLLPPRRRGRDVSSALNPNAEADRWLDTPSPAVLRRSVLAVALASSAALAAGGPPAALAEVSRPLVAGAFAAVCGVAVLGGVWGCTRGAEGAGGRGDGGGGARGAYGMVASDDHEVELRPFVGGEAGDGDDSDDDGYDGGAGRGDNDYLDEEDGYLADEGEAELGNGAGAGGGRGGAATRGRRVGWSTLPPAKNSSPSPPPPPTRGDNVGGRADQAPGAAAAAAATASAGGGVAKTRPREAPPAQSHFSVGHTVEL